MPKPSLKIKVQDLYLFLRFDYGETNLITESGQTLKYIRELKINVDKANTFVNNQAKLAWVALLRNSKPNEWIDYNVLEWFSDSYNPFTLSKKLMEPKTKGRPLRNFEKLFKNYYANAETSVAVKNQLGWNAKELITFVHFGLNTKQVREVLENTPPGTIALFFDSEKGIEFGARTGVLLAEKNSSVVSVTPPLRPAAVPIHLRSIADRWKDSAMLYNVKGEFYSVEKMLRKVPKYITNERFKGVGACVAEEGEISGESTSDQNLARWLV